MVRGVFVRPGALSVACVVVTACVYAGACGGDKVDSDLGGAEAGTSNPPSGDSGTPGNPVADDAEPSSGTGDGATVTAPKLKAIGSPCSADSDCTSGMCDTTFPNGMCTKACTMDTDCAEKGDQTGAACIDSLCYEFCKETDGGTVTVDGGKTEGPCKNKAFECEAVANETEPVCMPNPDAGSGNGGDDAGSNQDAGQDAADASGE